MTATDGPRASPVPTGFGLWPTAVAAALLWSAVFTHVVPCHAAPVHGFIIGAHDFDRGNVRVSTVNEQYADLYPCVWNGGKSPNRAEYDIELPVDADYTFSVLYTAAGSRPVEIRLNGELVHTGIASVTGSWSTSGAQWEDQFTRKIAKGRHTITLRQQNCMPHICALGLASSVPFPDGWEPTRSKDSGFDWRGSVVPRFTVSALDYDRSNLRVSKRGESYAGGHGCVWNGEKYPNYAEYELELPVAAEYTVEGLYAAAASRPVDILVDGRKIHTGFASETGSWNTESAKWETQCTVALTEGTHIFRLERRSCVPHICGLRLTSSVPFPPGWRLRRPGLEARRQHEAKLARLKAGAAALDLVGLKPLRRVIDDVTPPASGVDGERARAYARLAALGARKEELLSLLAKEDEAALAAVAQVQEKQRGLLLQHHGGLDFSKILLIKRSIKGPSLGLPQNWQSNCALPRSGYDDRIAVLDLARVDGDLATLFRPDTSAFVGDVDLRFDGERLLFSSIGTRNRWHVFEVNVDGSGLRQVTPDEFDDSDSYDACYLPDGRIIFSSTRTFVSVPCVNGSTRVANLFIMDADGTNVRQLCFDQEHNWCPAVMNDGRVLYTRWEYADTPHAHSRLLFRMNPDGTQQMEYYGSNSYWPNAMFYTRPIPGHPTKVVTIVSGHHGVRRMGELVVLDPAEGRHEADGVVQRIPGFGKRVEALIEDNLVDGSWPKFLHPYPLSEELFLVSCQPSPQSLWGIYLVDVFDNVALLREEPGYALLEPIPLRPTTPPPAKPDQVNLERPDCLVYMADVYRGPGLAGIPRGTVKRLRLFTYTYDYPGMGGPQGVVGLEGPWDVRRILGTVPVEPDGSALFRVPANTPVSVQPLDEQGAALQLMRSWMTGMPGEVLSCVGCHESQNQTPPNIRTAAARRPPVRIAPWRGPARGFGFQREVQPVLDAFCLGCHSGTKRPNGTALIDLRGDVSIDDYDSRYHHGGRDAGKFSVAYANLQRFVRRPGLESDIHLLTPMECHANTTQLVQMLRKGHHGVKLSAEAWDRLITWIDLNAPYHGSWLTIAGGDRVAAPAQRRREMMRRYAGVDVDTEWTGPPPPLLTPVRPSPPPGAAPAAPSVRGWPIDPGRARERQQTAGSVSRRTLELAKGLTLELVLVPGGEFPMGAADGFADETPPVAVGVDSFWLGRFEVTNEQYARFDPDHDSRVEIRHGMQFGVQGWPLNQPKQPVVRVSWERALAFCRWLREQTGETFALPTEAQWEYACRAGSDSWFSFGGTDADFAPFANLADQKLRDAVSHPYKKENVPLAKPTKYDDWIPRDTRWNDGQLVSAPVGSFEANAWGLHDMHGNVWEWTLSAARPYPYVGDDGRNQTDSDEPRAVRGGSWRDRPQRARASFRLAYRPYQRVYNVGFRVACPVRTVASAQP